MSSPRCGQGLQAHERAATFPARARLACYNLACAYALERRVDDAFAALERALASGYDAPDQLAADADLLALHEDPRWPPLLERARVQAEHPPWTALHFWLGTWDVYAADGTRAGRNALTLHDGGALHERWVGASGPSDTGESWSYWDPARAAWVQIWIDAGGAVAEFVGQPSDGGILFEGTRTDRAGNATRHRMLVRPLASGRVRQTGTTTQDGGATWLPRYDFVYVPEGEPFARP